MATLLPPPPQDLGTVSVKKTPPPLLYEAPNSVHAVAPCGEIVNHSEAVNHASVPCDDGATSSAPPPKASPLHVDSSSGSDDGSSSTIGSHADSFYASLVAAQQLRHQRTAALSTGAASSGTESGGLLSPSSSQPPRTLQDLLAWRQELLETRMKEHTERQQQYWQDSLSNSNSSMNASRGIGAVHSTLISPVTPEGSASPLFPARSSVQCSPRFASQHASFCSPTDSTEDGGLSESQLRFPPCSPGSRHGGRESCSECGLLWSEPASRVASPTSNTPKALPYLLPGQLRHMPPYSHTRRVSGCAATPTSARVSSLQPFCDVPQSPLERQRKARQPSADELVAYMRLQEQDAAQFLNARVAIMLIFFVVLSVWLKAPYVPSWFWPLF